MTKNRENIRIYGDDASGVWVADKGTTGPVDLAAPAAGFSEVGWISDAGVDLDRSQDTNNFNAWQGGTLVRTKVTNVVDTLHFVALEENLITTGLYYKGQAPTVTGTAPDQVATITVTNQSKSDERAWVVDFWDGDVQKRLVIPSGEVTDRATIGHSNADMTMYDMTLTIYGTYELLSNAPALTAS